MTFFRAIHMVGLGSESVIQSWLSPGSMEVSLLRIPKNIRGFLDRLRALEDTSMVLRQRFARR